PDRRPRWPTPEPGELQSAGARARRSSLAGTARRLPARHRADAHRTPAPGTGARVRRADAGRRPPRVAERGRVQRDGLAHPPAPAGAPRPAGPAAAAEPHRRAVALADGGTRRARSARAARAGCLGTRVAMARAARYR